MKITKHDNSSEKRKEDFPSQLKYNYSNGIAFVKTRPGIVLRQLDCWALAYISDIPEVKVLKLIIEEESKYPQAEIEALLRRVSYLNLINTEIKFELEVKGEMQSLYSKNNLFKRSDTEKIHNELKQRKNEDQKGRLEKDFQVFLGEKLDDKSEEHYNKRIGLLGMDFYDLKNNFSVMREFPTGAFNGDIKEDNRILPTNYVDIVTFNKYKKLAVVELKLNDPKLEVISQILDYALFFEAYKDKIVEKIKESKKTPKDFEKKEFCYYVVNNHYHPLFDSIMKYYVPKKEGLKFRKITLGYSENFN
jgi:hypothetical protein